MSLDGSFVLELELKRFLARCPKLQSLHGFRSIFGMGIGVSEEQVVNAVAKVLIQPDYTIPLVGCFRPVAQKIVDRAVAMLELVPNLGTNSSNVAMDIDEKELGNSEESNMELADIINFYAGKGKGLDLHELACLAFCRVLDLAPFLLGSVLSYFRFAPPPFERFRISMSIDLSVKTSGSALNAVRISYRFLRSKPDFFWNFWDWSCFLDLVKFAYCSTNDNAEVWNDILDIRWCAVGIVSITSKMSEKTTKKFSCKAGEDLASSLRWDEFCRDTSLEKAGWYPGLPGEEVSSSPNKCILFSDKNRLEHHDSVIPSTKVGDFEPAVKIRKQLTWGTKPAGDFFVLTSNMKKCCEMVQLAVNQKWPVLLYGPAGSGKTALISMLARNSGNEVRSIHMDDQIDGKMLVGGYVCTEQPGEFRWQPGSLTLAVMKGFWVVFEDIDKAPADVQSILLPLLEGAVSFMTGNGQAIPVAEQFRLFSTISSSKRHASRIGGGIPLSDLWRKVMIPPPGKEDLQSIVRAWYRNLEPLAERIIDTYERVVSASTHNQAGSQLEESYSFSRFTLRDLLKWCKRISGLGINFVADGFGPKICDCICQEAVDIFFGHLTSAKARLLMQEILKMWPVSISVSESLYSFGKPEIQGTVSNLKIGRVTLERFRTAVTLERFRNPKPFVHLRSSLNVLERIACSVKFNEPVLLVGETGTGKTTLVQNLASRLGQELTVLNLSQQSDVADLLGGVKPTDARFICVPLYNEFMALFSKTYSVKSNEKFHGYLQAKLKQRNWEMLLSGLQRGVEFLRNALVKRYESGKKRKKFPDEKVIAALEEKLKTAFSQTVASSGVLFSFVEGAFVTALREGQWILLDEINLAPPESLNRIINVLDNESGSLWLAERGDADYIYRHPNFRIFACMNPATDAGKRDLPLSLRNRFSEYFVEDVMDDDDLSLFINKCIDVGDQGLDFGNCIMKFYKAARKGSEEKLQDGANQKPQYSLRSLYRALEYSSMARTRFGYQRSLYDGFSMFFLNLLDGPSSKIMKNMILSLLLEGKVPQDVPVEHYLSNTVDSASDNFCKSYVITRSVSEHLKSLAHAIFINRYPVLLQGPTSSGKTSLVRYLAAKTGHEFVRINNHEHTDLQEYLGSYVTDASGKLVFQEGALVKAVRYGHWIVLDELNLAPSDVLEALNRLLDDNRELFIPELCSTIKAHKSFMLFATQNPPNFYGGRKMLSRAFRNRFVEIHVDEIPEDELSTILEKRCGVAEKHAKQMVEVMKGLQMRRQRAKVFAGKHGFITPRDLFRWADRFRTLGSTREDFAREGYLLLAERLRDESEKKVVEEVLESYLGVTFSTRDFYKQEHVGNGPLFKGNGSSGVAEDMDNVVWTRSMQRLYYLVERCYQLREPVLLVGETGGGKTTICQLLSLILGSKLHILNCHQYSETADFLGGFYPVRDRSRLISEFTSSIDQLMLSNAYIHFPDAVLLSQDINQAATTIDQLTLILESYISGGLSCAYVTAEDLENFRKMMQDLAQLNKEWGKIFTWQDGPLVQAMKNGDLFLVDEISLAEDSVLERLNSVLESERKLSLAEKGGSDLETIVAHPQFFFLATMNPGGDHGKKELSPALRNRFTEIWVPPVIDLDELQTIASYRFSSPELCCLVDPMLSFCKWFNQSPAGRVLGVRDLLSWVDFINVTAKSLQPIYSLLHGLFLVLLDGLTLGTGISSKDAGELQKRCFSFVLEQLKMAGYSFADLEELRMENYGWGDFGLTGNIHVEHGRLFGMKPFYIEKGDDNCESEGFEFFAPTTRRNTFRLLRAMQLPKPVLLEGSPGVGKTSLIVALGKFSGHRVVRINLSDQTDMMDLLGSDLPAESGEGLTFTWSDGILLQALKEGCWVLLDELNLAPQSVLEGLNAILDHRAEVFIPELNKTFKCPPSFRIFACQNPSSQGGGRKGLPRSLLNRFTKVYVDELVQDDYLHISSSLYPSIPRSLLSKLIVFNKRLYKDIMVNRKFGQVGLPWEFNLRDVIRSCQLIQDAPEKLKDNCFLNVIYVQRMRTEADRVEVLRVYEEVFGSKPCLNPYPRLLLNPDYLIVGKAAIKRTTQLPHTILSSELKILPGQRLSLEAAAQCVQFQWLCILIGPSGSGKTSLLRLLAQLTGNVLNELNLSSTTDISEILGCFEQYNAFRSFREVISQVERYVNEFCSYQLESASDAFISEKDNVLRKWLAFTSTIESVGMNGADSAGVEHQKTALGSLGLLMQIIEKIQLALATFILNASWCNELCRTLKMLIKLQEDYSKRPSAKFEWAAGLLIKAIRNGEWIVLENANVCSPTVLDRINSLVEPSGSITINECGIINGEPVILQPHPSFRIFLTVNPNYGDVSRAMRNRGVEIHMMAPYWLLKSQREEAELKEVKRYLVLSGIPNGKLIDSMAKSHIYAKEEGKQLKINITYLELSRWVQLFLQLLIHGNQLLWSLWTSWEHTYISSFGEAEGCSIINGAKVSFLSWNATSEVDRPLECSLCLPGGWPMPSKLIDVICGSKELCIKQNCWYLEYLGARCASYTFSSDLKRCASHEFSSALKRCAFNRSVAVNGSTCAYLVNMQMLHKIMFPSSSEDTAVDKSLVESIMKLENHKLMCAATWVIEQVTEFEDIKLYLLWFSWMDSQLKSFCHFFSFFVTILEQEIKHSIWIHIIQCRKQILSHYQVNLDCYPIPMLSRELLDLTAADASSELPRKHLSNALRCIPLLRESIKQWDAESRHGYDCIHLPLAPVLTTLRLLEQEILDKLVFCPSFDLLFDLYDELLQNHILLWKSLSSEHMDMDSTCLSWGSLSKNASKFLGFFQVPVENLLLEVKTLDQVLPWSLNSEKSMLWINGGHPSPPPSSDLYYKHRQIFSLCELIWPTRAKSWKPVNRPPIDVVVSTNPELRSLAAQGVCMSLHIMGEHKENDDSVNQKLEEMLQMLRDRIAHEKQLLENLSSEEDVSPSPVLVACCAFSPQLLCRQSFLESWQQILPIIDSTSFFLDMALLEELALICLDDDNLKPALSRVTKLLENAFSFSLNHSSRSPINFLPHQNIMWALDAWPSLDAASTKVASFVLEMWFRWHASLWAHSSVNVKLFSMADSGDVTLPHILLPVKTAAVMQILQSASTVKDYPVRCLTLKAASQNLWHDSKPGRSLSSFLLTAARSLLQQMVYAHKKSFDADNYVSIKSILTSSQNEMPQEKIQVLCSLIASSRHSRLRSSLKLFIEPLLRALFSPCSAAGNYSTLAYSWFRIGGLRLHLLLCCGDLDPAMKHSLKYSQLVEKILSLEQEIKVREECEDLIGWSSTRDSLKLREHDLHKLEAESRKCKRKIVFRSDPSKYKKLKHDCDEFYKLVSQIMNMLEDVLSNSLQQMTAQICQWQETATCFIEQLSDQYSEYADIIQPVQVAVYEMKLGLSLLLSSARQKEVLTRVDHDDMGQVLDTIYSFMRFPRVSFVNSTFVEADSKLSQVPVFCIDLKANRLEFEMALLQKLATTNDVGDDKMPFVFQRKVAINQNILVRLAHFVANAKLLDEASFMLLDKIFDESASVWMGMKVQALSAELLEAQAYKFKPRAFQIDNIFGVDLSMFRNSLYDDEFSELTEALSVDDLSDKVGISEEHKMMKEEWNPIQDSICKSIVNTHNQLFGSKNLLVTPGTIQISDVDRLLSFNESYTLGSEMIKDFGCLSPSLFDDKLLPEHLLRLCLEHEQIFSSSHAPACGYNFYKDSNAPVMSKMLNLLASLKRRVLSLLDIWKDHPGLKSILNIIDDLLSIPLATPLSKALSGLQFLLGRAWMLQDNVKDFSLSDQLEPVVALMSSWQHLEFNSWPVLLDDVHDQYEENAGKLWFPLYGVIHYGSSAEIADYSQSTIQRLVEFIQTSNIGEFKKRLELLFAFYGHLKTGASLALNTSPWQMECMKTLYNVFGFYVQFLPVVLESVVANRRTVATELKELLKLCHWRPFESSLSIESAKKTRQKLKKLIQKYNDLLQQPLMFILNQETSIQQGKNDSAGNNKAMLNTAYDLIQLGEKQSSIFQADWEKSKGTCIQKLQRETTSLCLGTISSGNRGDASAIIWDLASPGARLLHRKEWRAVWSTLEKVCGTAIDCHDLWVDGSKSRGKRRAYSELLKLLESCGLSKHRSKCLEDQLQCNQWFQQPSYDAEHLLLTQDMMPSADDNVIFSIEKHPLSSERLSNEWKGANRHYFKCLASVRLLQQICLNFHKDFTLEQVNRSLSFLGHLVVMQQDQRAATYQFSDLLRQLQKYMSCFESLSSRATVSGEETCSKSSVTPYQHATLKCMWQQKQLLDCWCAIFSEESLLLKTHVSTHVNTCGNVKDDVKEVIEFIQKFGLAFQKSKGLLDNYLLGHDKTTAGTPCLLPYIISNQMGTMLIHNFQVMREFEDQISAFRGQASGRTSVKDVLLSHFDDVIEKGKLLAEEFKFLFEGKTKSPGSEEETNDGDEIFSELRGYFDEAIEAMLQLITNSSKKLCSPTFPDPLPEESVGKLTSWKSIYEFYSVNLQLDSLSDGLLKILYYARELVDHFGSRSPSLCVKVGERLKRLHCLLELVSNYSENLLLDSLALHKTVSILTIALANMFSALYTKGYGTCMQDQLNESGEDMNQYAKGTGMGEGAGLNDVSDQITDEDQLLGSSEKPSEDKDDGAQVPSKTDEGIEMEQDFNADPFSVSEESADGNNDDDGDELDSAMGQTGPEGEVVDEKPCDKEDDLELNNGKEKFESGPAVRDKNLNQHELRAKEEQAAADGEPGELQPENGERQDDDDDGRSDGERQDGDDGIDDNLDNVESLENSVLEKKDAYMDPTGINPDNLTESQEDDVDMNAQDSGDSMDELDLEKHDDSVENVCDEEEDVEGTNAENKGTDIEMDAGDNQEEYADMECSTMRKDACGVEKSEFNSSYVPSSGSGTQPHNDLLRLDPRNVATEMNWSNSSDVNNELAPENGVPSTNFSDMEIMRGDSKSGTFTDDPYKSQFPQHDSSHVQKKQGNPYRSVGDALEEWKERVNVSVDLQRNNNNEAPEDMIDEIADEYGYVSEFDKGTTQALGPATPNQIDSSISGHEPMEDGCTKREDPNSDLEFGRQASEAEIHHIRSSLEMRGKVEERAQDTDGKPADWVSPDSHSVRADDSEIAPQSSVIIRKSHMGDELNKLSEVSLTNDAGGSSDNLKEFCNDIKDYDTEVWRRYELLTTGLSQELAEQLRLVMEPTLASKLQGDYKTGKRINMKKVITYIASHFRKDKIWLRRTRPNKRDYQVVIAVDDSSSMSESCCGGVAIEALVTVCRAMAQLEVGNLAVASFGKKGNIKLLHDFDQPFTGEAGVQMISSLSFSQDNTILDEPMVDLLNYLNAMLDAAVVKARLPSGVNPLQQLVLIIADGRFHEKEKLQRCVRDAMIKKRMIAFLLLDNPQESIIDFMEMTVRDGKVYSSRYLDSFPFPYYIVLRNVQELPRTLADLLRQWFELMQSRGD